MKQKTAFLLLFLILMASLLSRLLIVSQATLPSYESYETLLQIDHIKATGLPVTHTIQGQENVLFPPLFYYLATGLSLIFPWDMLAKIGPSIIALGIILLTYELAYLVTRKYGASLCSALAVAFLPILFLDMFTFTPFTFGIVLMLGTCVAFLHLTSKNRLGWLLFLMTLFVLSHPLALFLIAVLLVYVLLMRIEREQVATIELEAIFLFTFFAFWAGLLFFKRALLLHGPAVIWQNTPARIFELSFYNITFLDTFLQAGILTIAFGVAGVYLALTSARSKSVLLMTSFTIVAFLLLWLNLVTFTQGIVLLGCGLAILGAVAVTRMSAFLEASKASAVRPAIICCIVLLFVATNIVASWAAGFDQLRKLPSQEEYAALTFLDARAAPNATILATLREGYFVEAVAKRPVLIDTSFLAIPSINQRFSDAMVMWDSGLYREAMTGFERYGITYLYFSPEYRRSFKKDHPTYIEGPCFEQIFPALPLDQDQNPANADQAGTNDLAPPAPVPSTGSVIYQIICYTR